MYNQKKNLNDKESKILKYYSRQNKNTTLTRTKNKKRTKKQLPKPKENTPLNIEINPLNNNIPNKQSNINEKVIIEIEKKEKLTKKQIVIMDD